MFERGERDQYPLIGKGGHPPLQAFLGPGCGCANARTHFTEFLLSLLGRAIDVLGDCFRPRSFGSHDFILSALPLRLQSLLPAPPNGHLNGSVAPQRSRDGVPCSEASLSTFLY